MDIFKKAPVFENAKVSNITTNNHVDASRQAKRPIQTLKKSI